MGHATRDEIFKKLIFTLENSNLSIHKLIQSSLPTSMMLGSDESIINKICQLRNKEVAALHKKKLVDIGFCNVHILHNAFQKGLSKFGEDGCDLSHYISKHFLSGDLKFSNVFKVVKASLALAHRNADIERNFSISSKFLQVINLACQKEL
ncbi:uncharacterized protein LOC111617069 [Centruroides sculpturatus]|uniref:uncharacterized protein LOC111617069 n=1 Tax=Centruroides sculpturatus TaxID=218467 RepID=UPI000C6E50E7|nr:uncharacterized protein LOC111617069 [Centruroides sculpturatus]